MLNQNAYVDGGCFYSNYICWIQKQCRYLKSFKWLIVINGVQIQKRISFITSFFFWISFSKLDETSWLFKSIPDKTNSNPDYPWGNFHHLNSQKAWICWKFVGPIILKKNKIMHVTIYIFKVCISNDQG